MRALLFGFDATREGRTWYPAFEGGRRGGRLVLATQHGERWVVERHGDRGGSGALAVRAPNGNQGGQETLDRLLRGADRDLFANVFAFGLGELQDIHTLSTTGVRGRIYGAGAGLGGASAVDLEKSLRGDLRDRFVPSGSKPPLNALLARIETLRTEIAALATQPEEYEAAHRERAVLEARATAHRAEARALRERQARLRNLRAAAPALAELAEVQRELDGGDPTLDGLPVDVAAVLDRSVAQLESAEHALAGIDEELAVARRERETLRPDPEVLECAEEINAAREAIVAVTAIRDRRADLESALAGQAALVEEQCRRVGGWEEARLLGLDDSIPTVQATRDAEERLVAARTEATGADGRWEAARLELASRERELGPDVPDGDWEARRSAVRELVSARPPAGLPAGRIPAWGVGAALALATAAVIGGFAFGQPITGVLAGIVVALAAMLLTPRGANPDLPSGISDRAALLARAGLPARATDADIAALAEELHAVAARAELAREQRRSLEHRRSEVARLADAREAALARRADAEGSWIAWLTEHGLPDHVGPAAAREMLASAGAARSAATERDRLRDQVEALAAESAGHLDRVDRLIARVDPTVGTDPDRRAASVKVLAQRLERARDAERRLAEIDESSARHEERRTSAAALVSRRSAELAALLERHRASNVEVLRSRDVEARARRALLDRARDLRSRLGGIAGGPDAVEGLAADARATDAAAVEAELAEVEAELTRIEAEEAEAHARIGALSARIQGLEAAEEIGARRQELAIAEGRAAAMAREWAVRAVTLRLLEETRQRYERERQPDVIRAAEAHFARITGGRYSRIVAPPGDASVRVETDGGEARVTEELSRGTAEQLYLAIRFGLIEEFARHAEPLPVVMDDILVNFDAERAERAASAIRDLAERHQVLYFTCHAWTAEMLDPEGARTLMLA